MAETFSQFWVLPNIEIQNNLEIEAELHVVSEQLLWWSLVPVQV